MPDVGPTESQILEQSRALRSQRQFCEAEKSLKSALKRLPNSTRVRNELALVYLEHREYDKAVTTLDQTLALKLDNEDALVFKSYAYRVRLKFAEAEKMITIALERLPKSTRLLNEHGWLYVDQKQYDRAIAAFDQTLAVDVNNEDALRWKSRVYRAQRKFQEAEKVLIAALERLPNSTSLPNERGWLYLDQKQYGQAITAFDQTLALDADNEDALRWKTTAYRQQRKFREAEEAIAHALDILPNSVSLLNERGWLYLAQKQYDRAIAAFDRSLALEADNEDALRWKSAAYRQQRKFEEAEKAITAALERLPNSAALLGERGWVYLDQKQYEQALGTFDEALALDPDNMLPILGRVLALRRLYRNGEALRLLQEFKLRYPADIEMRVQLGWFHIGQNDAVRARKEFESILKVEPLYPNAVNGLGAVYFNQGIYEEAENWFRAALDVEPNEPAFHTNLAWALVRETGESTSYATAQAAEPKWYRFLPQDTKLLDHKYLSESEEHCRAALELESDYGSAYGCLGVIAFKKGRFLEAEDFFLRGTRANPRGTEYVALGALYTQMGKHEEAKEAFREALLLDKNDSRALVELGNLYLQLNDTREATRLFRQAMYTNLNDEEPPRALAIGLMRSGEYGEAGRILRRALRQLDYSKRWRLHLTLSQLLTEMGEKNDDSELYEEALKEIKEAIALNPQRVEPYFHAGVVRFKLEDYRGALRDFRFCLDKDPDHFDAERNVRLVQTFTKEERGRTRGSLYAGIVMGVVCILMLIVLWALYLRPGVTKISETMVITFSPILLALSLVAFLLPWLIKLKLPGVEAELSQPKEKISKGPTGTIGFGTTSISSGPR